MLGIFSAFVATLSLRCPRCEFTFDTTIEYRLKKLICLQFRHYVPAHQLSGGCVHLSQHFKQLAADIMICV